MHQRKHELRQVLNAIFYVVKGYNPWWLMPTDLLPWKSVYYYYAKFRKAGIWRELNDALRAKSAKRPSAS
ncbi:transposase [Rudanella paleaurantiibacter]|uniref:transposase n=1 Tax=Rudanella paleaurantiibacter TaxID=2614655 RepID=UPI0021D1CB10|nr:transposase [Rudanella paleaurantiibacter]